MQVLGYALGQPGIPQDAGYRGLFGQMGFEEVLEGWSCGPAEAQPAEQKEAPDRVSVTCQPGDQIEDAKRVALIEDLRAGSPAGHRPGENLPSGQASRE